MVAPLFPQERPARTVLVTLLGTDPETAADVVERTMARFRRYDRIVYLTDDPDFRTLRARRATFEYVPAPAEARRHAPDLPWGRHLAARHDLLMAKWRPGIELRYGRSLEEHAALCERGADGQ